MREIKFRGKRIDNGAWIYGAYFDNGVKTCILSVDDNDSNDEDDFTLKVVRPETVGQFTGLKAKNDKDVYESDMLLDKFGDIYVIRWSDHWGGFCLAKPNRKYTGGKVYYSSHNPIYCGLGDYDIIGNLHDNLNLLGTPA